MIKRELVKIIPAVALLVLTSAPARSEIAFRGYMISPERTLFTLSASEGRSSGWLTLGQSFDGFALVAFDATARVLTLAKDGTLQRIRLVEAKLGDHSESKGHAGTEDIVISIGGMGKITVRDDAASLDLLIERLALAATMVPQPIISLQVPPGTTRGRIKTIFDLLKATGTQRISFGTGRDAKEPLLPNTETSTIRKPAPPRADERAAPPALMTSEKT